MLVVSSLKLLSIKWCMFIIKLKKYRKGHLRLPPKHTLRMKAS